MRVCVRTRACACVRACVRTFLRTEYARSHACRILRIEFRSVYIDNPSPSWPEAGFMNRRRLCQLTAAILTSDLTTHMCVL